MSDKKIIVGGGNQNAAPQETQRMGFTKEEIAAMKAGATPEEKKAIEQLSQESPEAAPVQAEPPVQQPTPSLQQEVKKSQVPQEFIDDEFEIPTEIVNLPSKGIFYPGGQDKVKIKYLTAEAEDIIFSPELINSGRVLDVLLNEGVVDSYGLNLEDMVVSDRNAVILELRKTGFGEDYETDEQTCPACSEKYSPTIDLGEVEQKAASEAPDQNGEFSVVLPVTKKNVKFRMLNGQDEKILSKSVSTPGKSKIKYNKMVTTRYTRQIMEIDGVRDKTYIKKFVGFMPLKDSTFLREYIKRVEPGFDLNVTLECPHCGDVHDKEIVLNPVKLFYPDADF